MRHNLLILSLCAMLATGALYGQRNEQAIADVAAGKLQEAKASWWGYDPEDATECLQAAINSRVPRLIVDNVGRPWIVRPLTLVSNQEIIFEPGVVVLAKANEFKGGGDCLFSGRLIENVTLRGYGATLRMRRDDYADPQRYTKAEWRHVLSFKSCRHIRVYGLTLAESGGDGIYLGTAEPGVTNKDVHIKDVVCEKNYRQGISVITAEDLLIENTILRDTAGTPPMAGIDFEPNRPDERLVNVVMRNCVSENNNSWGYVAYLPPLNASSAPVSLRLENCQAIGNKAGGFGLVITGTEAGAVSGQMALVNCEFRNNGGPAFAVTGNPPPPIGCRILVQGCVFADNAVDKPTEAPIVFATRQNYDLNVGGVQFVDVVVRDPIARQPMLFVDMAGDLNVTDVTGNLLLEKEGQRQNVPLTKEILGQWMPSVAFKPIPRLKLAELTLTPIAPATVPQPLRLPVWRLRGQGVAAVWARQGEQVIVTLISGQVGRYAERPIAVTVLTPSGKELLKTNAPFGQETPVAFDAPETGLYRLQTDAGSNWAGYVASTHPLNYVADNASIHFISSTGTLLLYVPAGTKEFGVRLTGEGLGEGIKAALLNPAGEIVAEKDNIARTEMFAVTLPQPSPGEIWTLKLEKPSGVVLEDFYVDPRGVPPLLAPVKEAVLKPTS